jgi:hypothetical protein
LTSVDAGSYFARDFCFFSLLVALPSGIFALVPPELLYRPGLYDVNLLFLLAGLFYGIAYGKYLPVLWKLPTGKLYLLLCAFLLFKLVQSYFWQDIPFREIVTVFRRNLGWPLGTLGFLLYTASLSAVRIERLLNWIFIVTFLLSVLYVFSNLFSLDLFIARVKDAVRFEGAVLMQNTYAIPRYLDVMFVFFLVGSVVESRTRLAWVWGVALLLPMLSFIRSLTLVFFLHFVVAQLSVFFGGISANPSRLIRNVSGLVIIGLLLVLLFPLHLAQFAEKIGYRSEIRSDEYRLRQLDTYTLDFRIYLIESSWRRTEDERWLGKGYVRESRPGSYDFVLGGDTLIAPVLYTEGVIGLILRLLPLLVALLLGFRLAFARHSSHKVYGVIIVSLLIPQAVNIVQTVAFTEYNRIYFAIALLFLLRGKHRDEEQFGAA